MPLPEAIHSTIDEGMGRAEKFAWSPGGNLCYAFAHPVGETRKTCAPKGRCNSGWIMSNGSRDSWDVRLDVSPGEGGLRRRDQ